MKEKILKFAKGDFSEIKSGLVVSEPQIIFEVEEGGEYEGSLYIGNEAGILMKGLLYSSCPNLSVTTDRFAGKEAQISYRFSAKEISAGENINGNIIIVSNCGEAEIPVEVVVRIPSIKEENRLNIHDLTGFANLVSEDPDKALSIFTSNNFRDIFLYRDIEKQMIYETLIKGSEPAKALEEFLIAIHKKTRVLVSVDRNNIEYSNCYSPFEDQINVIVSEWGVSEIKVSTQSPFIKLSQTSLWIQDYPELKIPVKFTVDAGKMRGGTNKAIISIETPVRNIDISISATKYNDGTYVTNEEKRFIARAMRNYIDYKRGSITREQYAESFDELVHLYGRRLDDSVAAICRVYVAILRGRIDSINTYMDQLEAVRKPEKNEPLKKAVLYAAVCYIKTLAAPAVKKEEIILEAVADIKEMYDKGYNSAPLMWFLINLDAAYKDSRVLYNDLRQIILEGCTSPVIYIELCNIIKDNPEYMHEWDEVLKTPLAWGASHDFFNEEMAVSYSFHIGRVKVFNKHVYNSLCHLYEVYKKDDILTAICLVLIRGGKCGRTYLKWYEKGIERQLRITNIYENYMESLPQNKEVVIPHQVAMYFMYDNRLAIKEKQVLFASIIRDKANNPSTYKSYSVTMYNFARRQLEAGRINDALSIIYEDCIRLANIDETIAAALPQVMFKHKISCSIPKMAGVCVSHREFEEEQYVPFVNGEAYVDIYSDNPCIVMVDNEGCRYMHQGYYTTRKMLHMDVFAEKCFEIVKDSKPLLAYLFCKCEKEYTISLRSIEIRRKAWQNIAIRKAYENKNFMALMQYYYEHAEGEYLDELLISLKDKSLSKAASNRWITLLIIRGMFDEALDGIIKYGIGNIEEKYLARLCEEMIAFPEKTGYSKVLEDISLHIYNKGEYTDNIIRYLAKYYMGPTGDMYSIWKSASGFGIKCDEIEEKLLAQILFSEGSIEEGMKVLDHYLTDGTDKYLKKGFVSYLAYNYITADIELSDTVWQWLGQNILAEYNDTCTLALLKHMSQKDELQEKEIEFAEAKINKFMQKGIIFPFFKKYSKFFKLPCELDNKQILMCVQRPGLNVTLRYKYTNGGINFAPAKESYYGVYIRTMILFEGEKAVYEFFTEKNQKKSMLGAGNITYEPSEAKEITRFDMINKMLKYYNNDEDEQLFSCLETYSKLEITSKEVFKML